jgi:hypothetical protein
MCGIAQTAPRGRDYVNGYGVLRAFVPLFCAKKEGCVMNLNLSIGPLVSLIAGILILVVPRLLSYIVAIYLIVIGLLGLFGGNIHLK